MAEKTSDTAIILFDGVCNFCNSTVNFIIKHDKKKQFRFAALQSEAGKKIADQFKIDTSKIDSIVLIENDKLYIKSTAALRIAIRLDRLYSLFYALIVIPAFIRNFVYDVIAKNRYKWFGKKDACMIPSEEIRSVFLA